MVFGKSIQIKNKEYLKGYSLYSYIFIFWNKYIVSYRRDSYQILCVFLFYLCLYWWLMFIWSPVEKLSEVMFKFLCTIIQNFWNRILKIENRIFAHFLWSNVIKLKEKKTMCTKVCLKKFMLIYRSNSCFLSILENY